MRGVDHAEVSARSLGVRDALNGVESFINYQRQF